MRIVIHILDNHHFDKRGCIAFLHKVYFINVLFIFITSLALMTPVITELFKIKLKTKNVIFLFFIYHDS